MPPQQLLPALAIVRYGAGSSALCALHCKRRSRKAEAAAPALTSPTEQCVLGLARITGHPKALLRWAHRCNRWQYSHALRDVDGLDVGVSSDSSSCETRAGLDEVWNSAEYLPRCGNAQLNGQIMRAVLSTANLKQSYD